MISTSTKPTMILGIILILSLVACPTPEQESPQRRQVDQHLLAALGMAQSYQHQAEELEIVGDRQGALAKVRQVLEIPFPEGTPEGEDLRLDAWGRIAELHLEQNDLGEAEEALQNGLDEARRTSFFKARLFAVRGRLLRARAAQLREVGDEDESRQISRQAIEAFEQSIAINREVLGFVDGRGAEPGRGD